MNTLIIPLALAVLAGSPPKTGVSELLFELTRDSGTIHRNALCVLDAQCADTEACERYPASRQLSATETSDLITCAGLTTSCQTFNLCLERQHPRKTVPTFDATVPATAYCGMFETCLGVPKSGCLKQLQDSAFSPKDLKHIAGCLKPGTHCAQAIKCLELEAASESHVPFQSEARAVARQAPLLAKAPAEHKATWDRCHGYLRAGTECPTAACRWEVRKAAAQWTESNLAAVQAASDAFSAIHGDKLDLLGCTHPAVVAMWSLQKSTCACQDMDCITKAGKHASDLGRKYAHAKGTPHDAELITLAGKRASACISRLTESWAEEQQQKDELEKK